MSGQITITLTDKEAQVLYELSNLLDLPQDRVMIQALRAYQASLFPVPDNLKLKDHFATERE